MDLENAKYKYVQEFILAFAEMWSNVYCHKFGQLLPDQCCLSWISCYLLWGHILSIKIGAG